LVWDELFAEVSQISDCVDDRLMTVSGDMSFDYVIFDITFYLSESLCT
jgi:hypothetical protein